MSVNVRIVDVVKKYGDFTAVDRISLDIKEGEFFTLLGPSGCGKTTLLRMIAGFNSIESGEIFFGNILINNVDAHKRDIGMVFQNYAIFPHLTVEENVAYGLKARKIDKSVIAQKVDKALKMVKIDALRARKPSELSGGQQQRVALARAFVIEPKILLMDEPLSNLDAKLRVEMRTIIKKLQRELGITTIYVTHDQEEALAISDRIAVMKDGKLMQTDTPEYIYKKPQNTFVSGFIGVSNYIECEITQGSTNSVVKVNNNYSFEMNLKKEFTGKATISARPEQIIFADKGLSGKIVISTFLGDFVEYEILLETGQTIQLNEYTKDHSEVKADGTNVHIAFAAKSISVYSASDGEVLSC